MSLSAHNLETGYRKMSMRSDLIPAEVILVIKDYKERLDAIDQELKAIKEKCNACQENNTGNTGVEKTPSNRSGSRKLPKKKVSSS